MKLTYKDLFVGQQLLAKVWDLQLAAKLFMKLRRLDKAILDELKLFEPEKIKLFKRHPQFIKDNMFNAPKPGDDGHDGFVNDYNETFGVEVEIKWENEDILAVEKKIEESKVDVDGESAKALLDLIEQLNQTNDLQKVEPAASTEA